MFVLEYLLAAIISAAALIVLAKIVLQKLIRRPSDYYDKEEERQDRMIDENIGK